MVKNKDLQKNATLDEFATEKVNVISNCLLGNYVGKEYVISDEIKDELIEAVKVKKSVFKNSVFCGAFLQNYGELIFEVTFQKNTVKNIAKAELYVLENEHKINGYIQNTIRTKVGEYIDKLENFIEKTYNHFNIVLTENGGKEYNLDEDISIEAYIGAKRNFNINMAKLTQREYNKLYRDYVTKRLELLKKMNTPYTQSILEKFNEEYAKIEKYFLQDNNYKSVSELLDKCIEDCTGINPQFKEQEVELMKEMSPIVEEFTHKAEEIAEKAHPKAMENLNKQDRTRMEEIEMHENQSREFKPVPAQQMQGNLFERELSSNKPSSPKPNSQPPKGKSLSVSSLEDYTNAAGEVINNQPDKNRIRGKVITSADYNKTSVEISKTPESHKQQKPLKPTSPNNQSVAQVVKEPNQTINKQNDKYRVFGATATFTGENPLGKVQTEKRGDVTTKTPDNNPLSDAYTNKDDFMSNV